MPKESDLFFVYGSLKPGYWNNDMLVGSEYVGVATLCGAYKLKDGGFPYLVPHEEAGAVRGCVYRVNNPQTIQRLDWLEGVNHNHYDRVIRKVMIGEEEHFANVYLASNDTAESAKRLNDCPVIDGAYEWGQ